MLALAKGKDSRIAIISNELANKRAKEDDQPGGQLQAVEHKVKDNYKHNILDIKDCVDPHGIVKSSH